MKTNKMNEETIIRELEKGVTDNFELLFKESPGLRDVFFDFYKEYNPILEMAINLALQEIDIEKNKKGISNLVTELLDEIIDKILAPEDSYF